MSQKLNFTDNVDDSYKCEIYNSNIDEIESQGGITQQFLKSCFVKQKKKKVPPNIYVSSGVA